MTSEIPSYGLRAYALFFLKHGSKEEFKQSELDWMVSSSMKKKIFALLVRTGWIQKKSFHTYVCIEPSEAIKSLLDFKVPNIISTAKKTYAFTRASAVEIWSDFSYMQRGREKSPYYIKVLKKDVSYWKDFFHKRNIPVYINKGTTIGEFVILIPTASLRSVKKHSFSVEPLQETLAFAKTKEIYRYAVEYIQRSLGKK